MLGCFLNEDKVVILTFHICIQPEFLSKHMHVQIQKIAVKMALIPLNLIHLY